MVVTDSIMTTAQAVILSDLNTQISHLAIGTSDITPVSTDTQMTSETFRSAVSISRISGSLCRFIITLDTTENNEVNAEIGSFDASVTGNMSMHSLLNSYTKTSSMEANYILTGKVELINN